MVDITLATREKSKLRIALAGVSGGGKTLGALLLAAGLTGGDFSKVCLIDTEHRRGLLYANRSDLGIGQFYHIELKAPYSPDHYKEAVDAAVKTVGPEGVVAKEKAAVIAVAVITVVICGFQLILIRRIVDHIGFGVVIKMLIGRIVIHRADITAAGFLAVFFYIGYLYSCSFAEHLAGIICAERHPVVVRP